MSGEQLWEDVVLPGFDQPDRPVLPPRTAKETYDDGRVIYRRYRAQGRVQCDDCLDSVVKQEQTGISAASYIRIHNGVQRYLCFRHKQEREHRDQLDGNR